MRLGPVSSEAELCNELAGPRRILHGRSADRSEAGDNLLARRGAGPVRAAGQLADGRRLRADADSADGWVVQVRPVKDVGELGPKVQAHSLANSELTPEPEVFHGAARATEIAGVLRPAILPRRRIGPGCRI